MDITGTTMLNNKPKGTICRPIYGFTAVCGTGAGTGDARPRGAVTREPVPDLASLILAVSCWECLAHYRLGMSSVATQKDGSAHTSEQSSPARLPSASCGTILVSADT